MTLSEQRRLFARLLPRLIDFIHDRGDECELGRLTSSAAENQALADAGVGIVHSLHGQGLAIDITLFVDGQVTNDVEDYRAAGDHWKSLDTLNRWGGDFRPRVDAYHFSSTRDGIK